MHIICAYLTKSILEFGIQSSQYSREHSMKEFTFLDYKFTNLLTIDFFSDVVLDIPHVILLKYSKYSMSLLFPSFGIPEIQ